MRTFNIKSDYEELGRLGFTFSGCYRNEDNYIQFVDAATTQISCTVNIVSGRNNSLVIGHKCSLTGSMMLSGSNNAIRIDGDIEENFSIGLCLIVQEDENTIHLKSGVTAQDATLVVQRGTSIIIEEDCMLSYGVVIRTTDSHAVIDMDKKAIINAPADVVIGQHVWLCEKTIILKGTKIAGGSILCAGAVATGSYPPNCLIAGIPAKVKRTQTTWHRTQEATQQQIEEQIVCAQRVADTI
ncbi:acyltransferase [Vibrio maritimus]